MRGFGVFSWVQYCTGMAGDALMVPKNVYVNVGAWTPDFRLFRFGNIAQKNFKLIGEHFG